MTLQEIRVLARTVYEMSCDEKSTADRHILAQLRNLATAIEAIADHIKTAEFNARRNAPTAADLDDHRRAEHGGARP